MLQRQQYLILKRKAIMMEKSFLCSLFFLFGINNAFKARAKILRKHRQKVQKIQKLREAKDHWEGFFLPLILTKEDTLSMKK